MNNKIIEDLLPLINPERFSDKFVWLDIGQVLHNTFRGDERGLDLWKTHTKSSFNSEVPINECIIFRNIVKSRKYKDRQEFKDFLPIDEYSMTFDNLCKGLYENFTDSSITVRTLAWYVREFSPKDYEIWLEKISTDLLEKKLALTLKLSYCDISDIIYYYMWLDKCWCNQAAARFCSTERWFQFKGNRWVENYYSQKFVHNFQNFLLRIINCCSSSPEETDTSEGEQHKLRINTLHHLLVHSRTVSFRSRILSNICRKFCSDRFLDSKDNLFGVKNGVIESCESGTFFRTAKPEDYIYTSTNIAFNRELDCNNVYVETLVNWLNNAFTMDMKQKFLSILSDSLKDKKPSYIKIRGRNHSSSVSCLERLCKLTFGDHSMEIEADSKILSMKRLNILSHYGEPKPDIDRESIFQGNTIISTGQWLHEEGAPLVANKNFYNVIESLAPCLLWLLVDHY